MSDPHRWAHVRAGLIAVIIGVNVLSATPNPMRLNERTFSKPETAEELDSWMGVLASVGIDLERQQVQDLATGFIDRYVDVRSVLITKPTRYIRRWVGIRQNWALFARPDTFPTSLAIDTRGPNGWTEVYRSLHPDHDALEPQLRYRRVRGMYDVGDRPAAPYNNLCAWTAQQLFESDAEIEAVRCRLIRRHTVRPGKAEDPSQQVIGELVHERGAP